MTINIFKITILIAFSFLAPIAGFAQLVLNNGGILKLNGGTVGSPIYVVLNTPPATPIATIVTAGTPTNGIVMEAEYNILQYNLATATTPITVPYLSNSLEEIPFTLTPSAAGVGAGNIKFSSTVAPVRATGWDNTAYLPSDVLNMGSIGVPNNSDKTIDRFWIIDANAYTTKPAVTLNFTYIDAEWVTNGTNTITEASLRAQRYNTTLNSWQGFYGFLPSGTINTTNNTVLSVNVSAADFFRSWTLNDNNKPLPIELINFEYNCINYETLLEWCTASETNNHYFTIEQSIDGINFTNLATVNGNGTSSQKNCYQYLVNTNHDGLTYYQLSQTDFDNTVKKLKLIAVQPCNGKTDNITITNNGTKNVTLFVNSLIDSNDEVVIHNTLGQILMQQSLSTKKGKNEVNLNLNSLANSVYYITIVRNNESLISKKIIIADN